MYCVSDTKRRFSDTQHSTYTPANTIYFTNCIIVIITITIIRPGNGSPSATNVALVVALVVSTKAFSFHNRSSSNIAYRLVTTLSTIAPCRIFKLISKIAVQCTVKQQQQLVCSAGIRYSTLGTLLEHLYHES